MLQFLNRFSGIIVGGVLYPLKSLLINVGLAGLAVIAAPFVWVAFPLVILFTQIDENNDDFFDYFAAVLILPPLAFVSYPFLAILAFVTFITVTIVDVFRTAFLGFMDGAEHGLFPYVSRSLWSKFTFFTLPVQLINELYFGESSVESERPRSPLLNPETETYSESPNFLKLTQAELLNAETIADLRVDLERYKALFERLDLLDQAIGSRGDDECLPEVVVDGKLVPVDDEVITSSSIQRPSLLVKQYYDEELNCWKAVPVSTFIIDRANLQDWQSHCLAGSKTFTHPCTREIMDAPPPYKEQKTRHRIHAYGSMANAQELVEAASSIREHLAAALNKASQPTGDFLGQFSLLFFRRETPTVAVADKASDVLTSQFGSEMPRP